MDCEDRWTIKNYHVGFFINNMDTENAVSASGKELCMNRRTNKVIMILLVLLLLSGCSELKEWEKIVDGDSFFNSSEKPDPSSSSSGEYSSFHDGEKERNPIPWTLPMKRLSGRYWKVSGSTARRLRIARRHGSRFPQTANFMYGSRIRRTARYWKIPEFTSWTGGKPKRKKPPI